MEHFNSLKQLDVGMGTDYASQANNNNEDDRSDEPEADSDDEDTKPLVPAMLRATSQTHGDDEDNLP